MSIDERLTKLEKEVRVLKDEFISLKRLQQGKETSESQINIVDDYMIKLVYAGIYEKVLASDALMIGFPKNRKKLSVQISVGQKMFIYVTSPVKKIIGLMSVIKEVEETSGRWPYSVTLKWDIRPKQGVGFSDVGLEIRPRVGDTLYAITEDKAKTIINELNKQKDLTEEMLRYLSKEYQA